MTMTAETTVTGVSIVNADYPDPDGSYFLPPTPERPYWTGPEGQRLTVSQVWAGTSPETRQWIFELTWECVTRAYVDGNQQAINDGKIFRGGKVEHLLSELRSQLGPNHWQHG